MTYTVNVTKEHMKRGKGGDPTGCAVALALRDAIPHHVLHCGFSTVSFGDGTLVAFMPKWVEDKISALDCGYEVEPFTFDLEVEGG